MTEKPGHFEKGVWVENNPPAAPQTNGDAMEKRLSEATKAVISSIDNVMSVTHDLVATDEGKQFIETTIKDTQKQIQLSFNAIISRAKAELDKTKVGLDKTRADLKEKVAEPEKIKDELNKKITELKEKVAELNKKAAEPVKSKVQAAKPKVQPAKTKAKPAKTSPKKTKTQPKKK